MRERTLKNTSLRVFPDNWLHPLNVADCFQLQRPLEVDIGCGKGRFLLARARRCPDLNFLGIDRMLRRIRKVDRKAVRRKLPNIRLLRMDAYYATAYLMPESSVQTYYIFFPDPWPKEKHHKHRLFDAAFVDALYRTLTAEGVFHFATDHLPYFEEVAALMREEERFAETAPFIPEDDEKTDFELLYQDLKRIGRCSFRRVSA